MSNSAAFKIALCTALAGAGGSLLLNRLPAARDRVAKIPGFGLILSLESAGIVNVLIALALISLGGVLLSQQMGVSFSGGGGGAGPRELIPGLGF